MRNLKRWLAAMLTASMVLSDCGSMPAMAAENIMPEDAVAVETQEQPGVTGDADEPDGFVAGENQTGTPDEEDGESQTETPGEEDGENEDGAVNMPSAGEDSQIEVTLSGIEMSDKVYDGEAATYTGTPVVRDALSGEELSAVSVSAVYAGTLANGDAYEETEAAPAQAGSYTLMFTLTGTDADQYTLRGTTTYPFKIRQREVTVTADSVTVTAGRQIPELSALTYQVEGLLGEDTLSKEPSLRYSQETISTDAAGVYDIIPFGADAGNNYSITYVNGMLTVEAKEILDGGTVNSLSWEIDRNGKLTIEGKGDYVSDQDAYERAPWTQSAYTSSIKSAEVRVTGMTCAAEMFYCCSNLQSLDLSGFDTSKVTDMGSMFWLCSSLRSLDLSGFDTSKVTSMGAMFWGCEGLRSLDLSGFDTRNVTSMSGMFEGCSSLQSLDLSGFNTRNVIYIDGMFEDCSSLQNLNLGSFDTRKLEDGMGYMFSGCSSLQSLDLGSFDLQGIIANIDLYDCAGLSYIRTPKNCSADGLSLPEKSTWYDMEGKEYTGQMPALQDSIELFKGGYPGDGTMGAYVRVSGVAMAGKTYDGTPCAYTGTAVAVDADGSPIDGVTLTAAYSGTLADGGDYPATAEAPSQAGEYMLSFTVAGTDAEQYSLYQSEYRFRIDQRQVTITAPNRVIALGEQIPDLSKADDYTVVGLITGERLIKEPMLQYGKKDIPTDRPGMYAITPYAAEAGANYRIKYVEAALTVGDADGYDLSEAKINFPSIEYDGMQHPVTPDVQYRDWTLREGTDYRLEVLPADAVDRTGSYYAVREVGQYTIHITGIGLYYGEKNKTFRVVSAEEKPDGNIRLNRYSLIMQPGDAEQLTATALPENIQIQASWDSDNEAVATVNDAGEVTAKAEGITYITAEYNGETVRARVEVEPTDANDKILDLSGDIWVAGFKRESDDFVYNGQKITQDIRVYYKNTLLTEKTDYTLDYKNNINAAAYNTVKAPSVTINLKGQYSGSVTLHYTILPMDINGIDHYHVSQNNVGDSASPGYEQTVPYSAKLKIPSPVLTFGKKKLVANKDYTCDYTKLQEELSKDGQPADYKNGDAYKDGEIYHYMVNGIGNFTGSFDMQLVVLKDKNLSFNSAAVTFGQKQYEYQGRPLTKAEVTIEQIKLNGQILDKKLYDYEVCADGIEGAYVTVYPTEAGRADGYRGCKKVNLKLVGDRKIAEAVLGDNWKESVPFSQKTVDKCGGIFQAETGLLVFGAAREPLAEGIDYTIKYSNAKKAGKVTVTFTGKGRYKGTLKKKYDITPNADKEHITAVWGKNVKEASDGTLTVAYQKGGALPDFVLRDQNRCVLKIKTDYTIKLRNNKTPGEAMSLEITGKGNYKGYMDTVQLQVVPGDISLATISVPDKPYSTKANAWKSAVTVKDVNGKKLVAGTDYEKQVKYVYVNMESGQPPETGTVVTVTVKGIGCYQNELSESYRIFDPQKNISKLKIVIDAQEYTGQEITLLPLRTWDAYYQNYDYNSDEYNLKVYDNKTQEIYDPCVEICGYQNNIKAGTAKVTLRGIGDYGGTKTYSFKIQKKKYRINRVTNINLNKSSLMLLLAEPDEAKRTLTATLKTETDGKVANPTVIWSISDSRVATIEERVIDEKTVEAVITLKKEGSVTITATAQDGNKTAQCKLTVVDAPLLKQAGETIEGEAGQTAQLELVANENQEVETGDIKWESNNPSVVSVEKDGLYGNVTMKKIGAAVIKVTYHGYVQQCYVVVIGEETLPEGRVLRYNQRPGCTDDTPYINKMLRDWEWDYPDAYDYMYLPAGVYWIDPADGGYDQFGKWKFGGIILTDNQKLIMSPSALLITLPNSKQGYHVIWAFGRDNITISGGQIIGDRREHKGSGGEWGHGIQISGCTNVTIENVEISHCWGDGIYLGEYSGAQSNHVTITNCNLHHNRRSNLSITDVSNVKVQNCQFNNASGTAPQYGIDIEPNSGYTCQNVTISNCSFKGNAGGTIQILGQLNGHIKNVTIENCVGDKAPVKWSGFGGSVSGVTERNNRWG